MPPDPTDINPHLITPLRPHVMVLFGATGDLAPDAWRLPFERSWRTK